MEGYYSRTFRPSKRLNKSTQATQTVTPCGSASSSSPSSPELLAEILGPQGGQSKVFIPPTLTQHSNPFSIGPVSHPVKRVTGSDTIHDTAILEKIPGLAEDYRDGWKSFSQLTYSDFCRLNHWDKSGLSMARPLREYRIGRENVPAVFANPKIFAVPRKAVDFASGSVRFYVQAYNMPPGCKLKPSMCSADVTTPSGNLLSCVIREQRVIPASFNPPSNFLEIFSGSFSASNEIGLYTLEVELAIPCEHYPEVCDCGTVIIEDSVEILICRNYGLDSRKPAVHLKVSGNGNSATSKAWVAWGIACDKRTNRLYITEMNRNQVACVDSTGKFLFHFDQSKPGSKLCRPMGICCDGRNRRIILCDKDHHRVCIFSMDGEYQSAFGSFGIDNGNFQFPWDVDVNAAGTIIAVTDSRNKRIQLFTRKGMFIDKISVFVENPINYELQPCQPRSIAFDANNQVMYVSNMDSSNLLQIPLDLAAIRRLKPRSRPFRPHGLVVDKIGCMLVADPKADCVRYLSADGEVLSIIHQVGDRPLKAPVNVVLMQKGLLAILDVKGYIHIVAGIANKNNEKTN